MNDIIEENIVTFLFSFFINIFLVVITLLNGFQSNACIGSFEKKNIFLVVNTLHLGFFSFSSLLVWFNITMVSVKCLHYICTSFYLGPFIPDFHSSFPFFFCAFHWCILYLYSCSFGLFTSTVFYLASVCGVVFLYKLYVPNSWCSLNKFFNQLDNNFASGYDAYIIAFKGIKLQPWMPLYSSMYFAMLLINWNINSSTRK